MRTSQHSQRREALTARADSLVIEQLIQRAIAWWLSAPIPAGYALTLLLVKPTTVLVTALFRTPSNS